MCRVPPRPLHPHRLPLTLSQPEEKRGLIEKIQSQPWNKYLEMVERTRMILLPNVHDASPRVITEAMSLNVPILMNRNILGGWKYLEWTDGRGGAFFENQDDVVDAARKILQGVEDGSIQPREAIMSRWGHEISSARLRALLEEVGECLGRGGSLRGKSGSGRIREVRGEGGESWGKCCGDTSFG